MRDSQRGKVYKWEREWLLLGALRVSETEGSEIVRNICIDHNCCVPKIRRGIINARGGIGHLSLPAWAFTKPVILHELAHHLNKARDHHGPKFMGIFLYLLNKYLGWDYDTMFESCQLSKIKVYSCKWCKSFAQSYFFFSYNLNTSLHNIELPP